MDGKENEEKLDARTLQKRAAAAASKAAKRELMGDELYKLEKCGWRKRKADRAAAAATSTTTTQPQHSRGDNPGCNELSAVAGGFGRSGARWLPATSGAFVWSHLLQVNRMPHCAHAPV